MKKAKIKIDSKRCKACRMCVIYCRQNCIEQTNTINGLGYYPYKYKGKGCIGCMQCALICPETAIEVYKE